VFKARIHIEAYGRSGSHNQGTAGTRAPAPWENGPRCNDRNCHDGCNAVRVWVRVANRARPERTQSSANFPGNPR